MSEDAEEDEGESFDPASEKSLERRLKAWNMEADERIRRLLDDPYGRFAMRRLLFDELGLHSPCPLEWQERNEGRREAALRILGLCERVNAGGAGLLLMEQITHAQRR